MPSIFEPFDLTSGCVGASIEDSPLGGPILRLMAVSGTAEVALQGAQLLSWQPRGQAPVIWLSPLERLANPPANPKPVRGGTPVCWPWFGPHPADPANPAHGFVRTRLWDVDGAERLDTAVRVRLSTATSAADRALWPHAAQAGLTVTLGETLSLALTTTNTGIDAFALTQALHTYFAVGDIADVTVEGFDGQGYVDKVGGQARKRQAGAISFAEEVDRIYDEHPGSATIIDRGLNRRIEISKTGSRSSVVWNPWTGKATRLGDLGPHGWRRMVCVETCNAGSDVVQVAPGAVHEMTAEYRVVGRPSA
jgi:glucose-6-phosphate 1-epimerase